MLQVRLLAQFDVRVDSKRVVISSRAAQSLLAFLLLNPGTEHRREKLAGMLWPEMSEDSARHSLRHELWRLRKAIASQQTYPEEYLHAEEFTIGFNADSEYWLDVSQLTRDEPHASTGELIAQIGLYRGELLPGFYDDWVMYERERVQAIFERKMQQLLERLVADQQWNIVLEWAERWIALGDTPEPAYRALMIAHGAAGESSRVALAYERCVEALRNELGVEPSAETRALYEKLTRGETTTRAIVAPLPSILVQPSGTVTFLFSDIEGSTKLLEHLGNEYATLLADQRDIFAESAEKFGGHEVDTQGDAFFFAFFRAADAVAFAADAQHKLAAHPWPGGAALRVRMGLHTGEPMLARTGYVGMDVHRAARIGSAGHGGQVLMSRTTRDLVENDLPPGTHLTDLGEHKLKDLRYPVHIVQLTINDLPSEFPALTAFNTGTEPPAPGEPPFKGLQYFDESDAAIFFGREQLVSRLMGDLSENHFLAVVVGASGSGKSSVVRAGVIPALKRGEPLADGTIPPLESKSWRIHVLTPTAHPLEALAAAVTRDSESVTATATLMDDLAKDPRSLHLFLGRMTADGGSQLADSDTPYAIPHTLLVVDQFEELFTLCRDDFEREAFIDNLLTAISPYQHQTLDTNEAVQVSLIVTIRADFYAHLAQYPELRDAVARAQEYIGPMTSEELRRAIQEPALRGGWEMEPGLVDLMLRDVGDEPGALPLLSHALLETWKRRSGHLMTLRGYADAGGVRGAIAHTAESTYQQLSPEEQQIARNIFMRLTELGDATEDTRRRTSFDELIPQGKEGMATRSVLTQLADARLITTRENTAEVAHEALIREWPRLREWLTQDREGLRLHRQLTEAAQEWELLERDSGALYRGARLTQAREFRTTNPNTLNAQERAFLDASDQQEEQEARDREEQQRRELQAAQSLAAEQAARADLEAKRAAEQQSANKKLRQRAVILAGLAVLALLAAGAALFFLTQSNANLQTANEQRSVADTQRDAAQKAQAESEKQQRFGLARELAANAVTNLDIDPERSILLALQAVNATEDADHIVLPEAEEALHRAVETSRTVQTIPNLEKPNELAYSPDGTRLAIHVKGSILIWEFGSNKQFLTIPTAPAGWTDHLYFSTDGKRLATIDDIDEKTLAAKIFDVQTGTVLHEITIPIPPTNWTYSAFNPDWTRIVVGVNDGTATIYDMETGKLVLTLSGHSDVVDDVAYSPDGKYIATSSDDTTAKIWEAATGKELLTLNGHTAGIPRVRFSPDGKRVATGSNDGTARIWDTATGKELLTLTIPTNDWVVDLDFSPDGTRILTVGLNGISRVWDGQTGKELFELAGHTAFLNGGVFSPDGSRAATSARDGTVRIWDLSPPHEVFTMPTDGPLSNPILGVGTLVYSPDGTRLALGLRDGRIKEWNAQTGQELLTWQAHSGPIHRVAFSPDGKRLASASDDKTAKIWDPLTGKQFVDFQQHGYPVVAIAFSPDGKFVASGDGNYIVRLWDVNSGTELTTLGTPKQNQSVFSLDFSPDGSELAASYTDGGVASWDVQTGKPLFTTSLGGEGVFNVAFSRDGSQLAAATETRSQVMDAKTGKELFALGGTPTSINQIVYSPDGKIMASANMDDKANLWDAATGKELLTLYGNPAFEQSVAFSPDGTRLALASNEDVRVYLLRIEDLVALAKTRVTRSLTKDECVKYLHMDQCPQ